MERIRGMAPFIQAVRKCPSIGAALPVKVEGDSWYKKKSDRWTESLQGSSGFILEMICMFDSLFICHFTFMCGETSNISGVLICL